jgi:hypothetical protein
LSEQKKSSFERWRGKLPGHTRYLADLVAEQIVTAFESQGFVWHDKASSGFVYLVRQDPGSWPAVQIRFHKRAKPMALIDVACLPQSCRRWDGQSFVPVPREQAEIVEAPALFYLRNTRKLAPNHFGYGYFSILPRRHLRKEIGTIESLLPRLFEVFDQKLLENTERWPEFEDLLGLYHDRTEFFDEVHS